MNDSASKRTCPECGLDFFPRGKGHGCPHCLLALGIPEDKTAASPGESPPPPGLKSRFFADYEIFEELARGGMGVVYRARQLSLNREVALKMIQAGHLLSTEARLRFRVEIEAVAQLNHPNIVSLYESDEYEGIHYFTMRLVEGGNLSDRLRKNHTIRENIALLVKVCRTIHYAHQRGILHRDLKPSNILVDLQGEPHVADFGLAKSLEHETGFTYSSSILGSPNYMAPEQASNRSGQLTTAVDVHGLGAVLYQILTGQPPFQGKTALETIRQVLDTVPRSPRELNQHVDVDLATSCLKCLEKRPGDRYDSAEALAKDLDRWLQGHPIQARPVGVIGSLRRWSKRHPAVAVLSGALIISLIGFAVAASVAAIRIRTAERQAIAHLRVSLLDQARTLRLSRQMGMRNEGLRLVREAATLGGPPEFIDRTRDEMLAALTLTDMEFSPQLTVTASDPALSILDLKLERLATIVDGTNLLIRRVADGTELLRQSTGTNAILRVEAFSPDGHCLGLRDTQGLSFWDAGTGQLSYATNGPQRAFVFAPNAPEILLEEWGCALSVRDLTSFRELRRIQAEPNPAGGWRTLSVSPDGLLCAGARGNENILELIDLKSGQTLWRNSADKPINTIAWLPVHRRLATGSSDGSVRFWRLEDGAAGSRISFPGPVWSLAADRTNTFLAIACDRAVRLWHIAAYRQVFESACDSRRLWFDEDGVRLGTGQRGEQLGWLDLSRCSEYQELILTRTSTEVERCEFNSNGTLMAAGYPGTIDLRRMPDAQRLATLPVGGLPIFAFDPLGEGIVTSDHRGVVHRSMRETSPGAIELDPPRMLVSGPRWRAVTFSGNGRRFFAANASSNLVFVFDRTLTNCTAAIGPHRGVDSMAASPDGRWVATGSSSDRSIRVWNVDSGASELSATGGRQPRLRFSPDGRWLINHGATFELWATTRWSRRPPLPSPEGSPIFGTACFSWDGRVLAAVVDQLEVHLFDLVSWKLLGRLRGTPEARINDLAFSHDGRHLVAASTHGRLQMWNLAIIRQQLAGSNLDWDLPPLSDIGAGERGRPETIIVR